MSQRDTNDRQYIIEREKYVSVAGTVRRKSSVCLRYSDKEGLFRRRRVYFADESEKLGFMEER